MQRETIAGLLCKTVQRLDRENEYPCYNERGRQEADMVRVSYSV